ncbi:MAG: hypothetical protein GF409_03530 [Candidatus Omnitrophica bacterium]|nr:hypothetical protein [Candidatus Omnitrophota bacterium]
MFLNVISGISSIRTGWAHNMPLIRRLYRITALAVWLAVVTILSVPYRFRGWYGRKKISHILRLWARGVGRIINLRVKVHGDPCQVPGGLVVSNHLGYIDIVVHGSVFPLRFTSSTETDSWPVVGPIVALSNPVLVNRFSPARSKKAKRDYAKTIRRGMYLMVYPEGTSTDGKGGVLPFKSTCFEAVAQSDMPVIPVLIRYNEPEQRPTVCWYGDMTLVPHLWRILGYASIEADLFILPPVYSEGRSRKELASYVHDVMDAGYRSLIAAEKALYTGGKI